MEKQTTIATGTYFDPDHEAILNGRKQKLLEKVQLQGRHDGQSNKPTTPQHHRALILNLIEVTLQNCIDINQSRYLPISGMVVANMVKEDADRRILALRKSIQDAEHDLIDANNEAQRFIPDKRDMRMRKMAMPILVFLGIAETVISYPAFRHASFTTFQACIASIVIGGVGALGAHLLGTRIKKVKAGSQKLALWIFAVVISCAGFGPLAILRAKAFNRPRYSLIVAQNTPHVSTSGSVSAIAIAVLSVVLFLFCVAYSARYYRTETERLQEAAYLEALQKIASLEKTIATCLTTIGEIEKEKAEQMALALARAEYAAYTEMQIVHFAQLAAENYKQPNLRHRTDGCPPFLAEKPIFHFTLFFHASKQTAYEPA
jgi:hypothetical protein